MNFKVGDKVVFTGESGFDMTHGQTYQVCDIEDGLIVVLDDAGDEHYFPVSEFKPTTSDEEPTIDFAKKAATYGIKITVIVGDWQIVYDGSEVAG